MTAMGKDSSSFDSHDPRDGWRPLEDAGDDNRMIYLLHTRHEEVHIHQLAAMLDEAKTCLELHGSLGPGVTGSAVDVEDANGLLVDWERHRGGAPVGAHEALAILIQCGRHARSDFFTSQVVSQRATIKSR